ncbi:MAG: F0F1 ATP synthase subunit gamma [Planctomycetota bacterium]|jgi:F-type H+-transporting ATPase subunit gamma|nr:F0F1 ATP synthase subunit gamma [Planctomycetota bacterium]
MSDSLIVLGRKITNASDLKSVVRTMKAVAAANVVQFQQAVQALDDYYRTVKMGLSVCFREVDAADLNRGTGDGDVVGVIVFGSDQGLVGRFNEVVAEHVAATLGDRAAQAEIWVIGERVYAELADAGLTPAGFFVVPNSIRSIPAVMTKLIIASEARGRRNISELLLFHNRPATGASYEPVDVRLLPLDGIWLREIAASRWLSKNLPEIAVDTVDTARAFIREYLFVSLFQACAESLASENASRLAAMQRADKNIDELLGELRQTFSRQRQNGIDEELFDVIADFSTRNQPL